ncbi:MAG TPA: nucleotidyltransferase domain-containing protein [Candidatus Nanoarchaeia archaeon]|nr:nucleotidyltransferase domain-containing protein [Candidatus Nanoarchaeia archaeon]
MLNQLRKLLVSEKADKTIFDIIIYGSATKGKADVRDIDIAVIFLEGSLRQRLDKIHGIKQKLKHLKKPVDIKQIPIKDLFSSNFLARTGILLEGVSVFQNRKFSEILGFRAFALFWYQINNLSHSEKVQFNYILAGRKSPGLLKELKGERISSGAIKIPMENSGEFEEFLKARKVQYKKKDILEPL